MKKKNNGENDLRCLVPTGFKTGDNKKPVTINWDNLLWLLEEVERLNPLGLRTGQSRHKMASQILNEAMYKIRGEEENGNSAE